MNNTNVVAISGASGAGKTSVLMELANEYGCPFLSFDDFTDGNNYPENMQNWLINGANAFLIKTPKYTASLQNLISKKSDSFIFIEEPFGKERDSLSPLSEQETVMRI